MTDWIGVVDSAVKIGLGRGKILLLGEAAAVDALAKLHDACSAFFRIAHVDNPNCTGAALDAAKSEMVAQRTLFWEQMAKAYARIPRVKFG